MNEIRWAMRPALQAFVFALFALSVSGLAAQAADSSPDGVIAASGKAMGVGALPDVHVLHLKGNVNIVGVTGTTELWQDLHNGTFTQFVVAGALTGDQGFDGQRVWNRDATGLIWDDASVNARYLAQDQAYFGSYQLWAPDRGGATVTLIGTKTDGGKSYDALSVTPPNGLPFDVWFDQATHLPNRMVQPIGTSTNTLAFGDYRNVHGLRVPFSQVSSNEQGKFEAAYTSADTDPQNAGQLLARPQQHLDDFAIAGGSSTTIPFDLIENHVYLYVKINGKGPYRFIFDTGGDYLLDTDVAKQLGVGASGSAQGEGVGSSTEAVSFAKDVDVQIGNATLRKQSFIVAPVRAGFGVSGGEAVDGLIGFGVLSRFVTTFDYGHKQIVLSMPNTPLPANGTTIPFRLHGTQPMIDCHVGGVPGACTIDTGSRVSLSITSPFLAAHPAIVPAQQTAVGINGFGVGGPAMGRLGRVSLEFGGITLPETVSDLSTQTQGAFADPFTAGNIGGAVWKRFAVTFDYGHQQMALVPNSDFGARDSYDRSGLFLIRGKGGITVAEARAGTPAGEAGMARGDVIVRIDGKDATQLGLYAIRQRLLARAGTVVRLHVKAKDGTERNVNLTLRDYV